MINLRLFRLVHDQRLSVPIFRHFHHEFNQPELNKDDQSKQSQNKKSSYMEAQKCQDDRLSGSFSRKYKIFKEEEATEIFDVEEERQRAQQQQQYEINNTEEDLEEDTNEFIGINTKHGLHGVYDIEDLVDVLRSESAEDIFVCSVPKELKYVDYMVVCSGRSYRHMLAMAEFVRRVYKIKRGKGDVIPKIEGEKSRDWMALDLGNIALHIFSPKAREQYDLESLWAIGSQYDKEFNKPQDPLIDLYERHAILLSDINKIETTTQSDKYKND